MSYAMTRAGVLGDDPAYDDDSSSFDVILYRGAIVASQAGWIADAKARGGVITQVPGGFWHGLKASRFGSAPPYTYELPPVWLLVWDGVDVGTDEFLNLVNYSGVAEYADNQTQGLVDLAKGAGALISSDTIKYAAWVAVGLVALKALDFLPPLRRAR